MAKRLAYILVGLLLASGCSTRKLSTTSRTAVEQLLLSRAVDVVLARLDMPMLRGQKVFVDFANLKCTDAEYVQVALRARLAEQGAVLAGAADAADCTMEVASGALAMEYKTGVVGFPALPVPNAPIPLPEMSLYKTTEQTAIIKLLIFVHKDGRFLASDQYYAKSDRDESFLLWYRFQRQDDVREGWDRADLKLAEKQPPPSAPE